MTQKRSKSVDYKAVFGNESGKAVLSDLNKLCFGTNGYLDFSKKASTSSDGKVMGLSNIDPLEIARFEGRREMFLYILRTIKADNYNELDELIDMEMEF